MINYHGQYDLITEEDATKWWGYGEWVTEPDRVEFEYNGYECKILRIASRESYNPDHVFGGHLCGYVRIPKGHPFYEKGFDLEVDVHGGITYAEFQNEEWWIGFDCIHLGDLCPSMEYFRKTNEAAKKLEEIFPMPEEFKKFSMFNPTYRNISFVEEEIKKLVEQIIGADKHE